MAEINRFPAVFLKELGDKPEPHLRVPSQWYLRSRWLMAAWPVRSARRRCTFGLYFIVGVLAPTAVIALAGQAGR